MEIGEIISPAIIHTSPEKECPFCTPEKDGTEYKTYAGENKSEPNLKKAMEDPSKLESNTRPKQGKEYQQNKKRIWTSKYFPLNYYYIKNHCSYI